MKKYEKLTDEEIKKYQSMLILPNEEYPHYDHLVIDGFIVYQHIDEKLLTDEVFIVNKFFKDNYNINLDISNYGRIKINNRFIIPTVGDNIFKHGLIININGYGTKSVHRLLKETFDPIFEMEKYEVHHNNNNANNNHLDNLIWVSQDDHRKIDKEFNNKLSALAKRINKLYK